MENVFNLYMDIKAEINNLNIKDNEDDSYQYILNLLENYESNLDKTLTVENINNIKNILNNDKKSLLDCYFETLELLTNMIVTLDHEKSIAQFADSSVFKTFEVQPEYVDGVENIDKLIDNAAERTVHNDPGVAGKAEIEKD